MTKNNASDVWAKAASVVAGLSVFAICIYLRGPDFGAVAAFSVVAIGVGAYVRWDLHREPYYWPVLGLIGLAHLILLLRFSATLPKPTVVVAPLVFVDFVVVVVVLSMTERFWRSAD